VRVWVKQLDRRLVVELWLFPDGSRNLEISAKASPAEAFQFAAELKKFLADRGIKLTGNQQTKTRAAMEFFAPEVRRQPVKRKPVRRARKP